MKKLLFALFIIFFIGYSLFFPDITVQATKNGLELWFHQILPALLPFTILSSVIIKSDYLRSIKGNANFIAILFVLACGFVFGFPIGAKLSSDFCKQNLISEKQATILSVFTNNFSPMYVCGFVLPHLFPSNDYSTITYILLYLTPLILATIRILLTLDYSINNKKTTSKFHLNMKLVDVGIISGFESLIKICGYIILFTMFSENIINMLSHYSIDQQNLVLVALGNLEITNGITLLSKYKLSNDIKYILAIQFLSFGGLSGIAQTTSILEGSGISPVKYIIGKALLSLLLTLFSVIYVFIR